MPTGTDEKEYQWKPALPGWSPGKSIVQWNRNLLATPSILQVNAGKKAARHPSPVNFERAAALCR